LRIFSDRDFLEEA